MFDPLYIYIYTLFGSLCALVAPNCGTSCTPGSSYGGSKSLNLGSSTISTELERIVLLTAYVCFHEAVPRGCFLMDDS